MTDYSQLEPALVLPCKIHGTYPVKTNYDSQYYCFECYKDSKVLEDNIAVHTWNQKQK